VYPKRLVHYFPCPLLTLLLKKISCDNWLVDDQVLKKLVFEGLDYTNKLKESETVDLHEQSEKTRIDKKKRDQRKSLIRFSFKNAKQSNDNAFDDTANTSGKYELEGSDDDTAELLNDKLSTSYILEHESSRQDDENKENVDVDDKTVTIDPKSLVRNGSPIKRVKLVSSFR